MLNLFPGLGSKGQVEGRTLASECEMNNLQNLSLHLCSMRIALEQRRGVNSCRTTALGCSRQVPRRTTFQRSHWVLAREKFSSFRLWKSSDYTFASCRWNVHVQSYSHLGDEVLKIPSSTMCIYRLIASIRTTYHTYIYSIIILRTFVGLFLCRIEWPPKRLETKSYQLTYSIKLVFYLFGVCFT